MEHKAAVAEYFGRYRMFTVKHNDGVDKVIFTTAGGLDKQTFSSSNYARCKELKALTRAYCQGLKPGALVVHERWHERKAGRVERVHCNKDGNARSLRVAGDKISLEYIIPFKAATIADITSAVSFRQYYDPENKYHIKELALIAEELDAARAQG